MEFKKRSPLCGKCMARNSGNPRAAKSKKEGACGLCSGAFALIPALVKEAAEKCWEREFDTFSVSTALPRSMLVAEDRLWDSAELEKCASIKDGLNREVAKALEKKLKKKFRGKNADANFKFDFIGKSASFFPAPLFVFGRYLKYSRELSQSKWPCSRCSGKGCRRCDGRGEMYRSFENILASCITRRTGGAWTKLHAAGREDIDARMVGSGRPFVLEIGEPKKRKFDFAAVEAEMNSRKDCGVLGLRIVPKSFVDIVSNARFDKEYLAVVSAERMLNEDDAQKISELSGALISQRTPERVLHRRPDLVRKRKVISIGAKAVSGKLEVRVLAQAGTYIKELISGDNGRTVPSISSLLKCRAQCDSLDVVGIRDAFIETVEK
jgi:tRNA pseudouridine synthase 10